ncbi:RecBCD enzyme subunit RecD (plasmid) [Janthinobacterium sp. HH102]|uniref:MobF family relaxase n=1 Tax=Janthinobacterium sp. HH102 TaxID=1537274 RepID=UPI0008934E19|nr:MobF family relaxase [Janthinobacterium sp. HH102]QOU76446.1 RecBCD enzyme subunit RecD [Janthinobacterium sp. HH102]
MLSFKFVSDAGGAAHYFENNDDYYAKEGPKGEWKGKGAELLGLDGTITSKQFKKILEGHLPSGEIIRKSNTTNQGNGKKSKDRLGIDFTFSAPKSVSIAALVNGDERIIKAHDEAVSEAITFLESKAVARLKVKGNSFRQHTGNLTVATFRHELSRSKDPQLHTHAVMMNLTMRDDKKWVALTNDEILNSVKTGGAYYRGILAEKLKEIGYEIRVTKNGFELSEISDEAIKVFSKRSKQIEEALEKYGKDRKSASQELKQMLTLATRPVKTETDRTVLRDEWKRVLSEVVVSMDEKNSSLKVGKTTAKIKPIKEGGAKKTDKPFVKEKGGNEEYVNLDGGKYVSQGDTSLEGESRAEILNGEMADVYLNDEISPKESSAVKAVNFAIEHLMERQGIFTKGELLESSYNHALGAFKEIEDEILKAQSDGRLIAELPLYQSAKSFERDKKEKSKFQADNFRQDEEDLKKLTKSSWVALTMAKTGKSQAEVEKFVEDSISKGRLVLVEQRFTTGEMLNAEKSILRMEVDGRNRVEPIKSKEEVSSMFKGTTLNAGQFDAVELILTSDNRFVGVQGYAGVGKSHMLSEAVEVIKEESMKNAMERGYDVIGLAPYASQNKALADLGMKSQTLASFLMRPSDQAKLNNKTIVFLDEASVVPAHQMRDLMHLVAEADARLVMTGDRKQTQAVEAGKPFEQLQDAGMSVAHITEIQRQKNIELKSAVVSAANGRIAEAAKKLESRTIEIVDPEDRYTKLAKDFTDLPELEREKTLIVTGTNVARSSINSKVRSNLKIEEGIMVRNLESIDMSKAEKKIASLFSKSQILMFEGKESFGLKRNTQYEIVDINVIENKIEVVSPDGNIVSFDPAKKQSISIFAETEIALAKGDFIRITRNNTNLSLVNGFRTKVESVTDAAVILDNGTSIPRSDPIHLQYGWATTVHSSQGLTEKRVLIDADTSSLTSNRAVFYVAISRSKDDLGLYTDSKKLIGEVMSREPKKYAALELRSDDLEKRIMATRLQREQLNGAIVRSPDNLVKTSSQEVLKEKRQFSFK